MPLHHIRRYSDVYISSRVGGRKKSVVAFQLSDGRYSIMEYLSRFKKGAFWNNNIEVVYGLARDTVVECIE